MWTNEVIFFNAHSGHITYHHNEYVRTVRYIPIECNNTWEFLEDYRTNHWMYTSVWKV